MYLQTVLRLEYDFPWLNRQFRGNKFHCVWCSEKYWAELWTDLTIKQIMIHSIENLGGLTRGRGINEAVQNLWIGTLNRCSEVGQAMRSVTLNKKQTSEQDVEVGTSRCKIVQTEDLMVFYN